MDTDDLDAVLHIPTRREANDVSVHTIQIPLEHRNLQQFQDISIGHVQHCHDLWHTGDEHMAGLDRYPDRNVGRYGARHCPAIFRIRPGGLAILCGRFYKQFGTGGRARVAIAHLESGAIVGTGQSVCTIGGL